jgi:hypothetical protein
VSVWSDVGAPAVELDFEVLFGSELSPLAFAQSDEHRLSLDWV